jgi:hypothetical protein
LLLLITILLLPRAEAWLTSDSGMGADDEGEGFGPGCSRALVRRWKLRRARCILVVKGDGYACTWCVSAVAGAIAVSAEGSICPL